MGGGTGERQLVSLRPAREDDLPQIEHMRAAGEESELLVIAPEADDRPIGVLEYRLDEPTKGWATIDHLAVAEERRRWGLGQDAIRLFEDQAVRSSGIRHFRTAIDVRQGLALYLWLRLGYRPLDFTIDGSGHEALSMVRDAS